MSWMDNAISSSPSPSSSTSAALPVPASSSTTTRIQSGHTHALTRRPSVPYYTLDTNELCVTNAVHRPEPHFYPAHVADTTTRDDLTLRPPLRKKPKLSSTASSTHSHSLQVPGMRRLVGISKTSSVPSFNSLSLAAIPDNDEQRPSSSSGVSQSSTPLQRTNSNTLQRSPSQRRPPASHSSYGIETTCGPPPSYSTQRTLSQDRVRLDRNSSSKATTNSPSREGSPTRTNTNTSTNRDLSPSKSGREPSPSKPNDPAPIPELSSAWPARVKSDATSSPTSGSSPDETTTQEASSPETADTQSLPTPNSTMSKDYTTPAVDATDLQEKEKAEPRFLRPIPSEEDTKGSSSDEKKSEDLFLNIAKTDASRSAALPQSKLEKRRSRVSLPFFSNATRPSTGYKSSPIQERFDTASVSGRSEALNYYSKRSSLGHHVPGALSRAYTQEGSIRDGVMDAQSSHPADLPRRAMSRRYSTTNSNANTNLEPVRTFSRPSTARNSRLVSEGAFADRTRVPDHNATESTISTTAPSTVWDELDDLKSRIKKLELTGKLPPSSAAAMTSTERPKTATTAATTTMSSSPKHKPTSTTQLQSAIEGIPSSVHPNLHDALGNAKTVLSNDVYQKLQATAQDALQLSMMMSPEGPNTGASTIGATSLSERQIRRRTESMCRSLTELAIAILADNKQPPQPTTRPGSRDAYQSVSGLRSRRASNEPSDRPPVSMRVQSRLDARRTSAQFAATLDSQPTPPENAYQTPPTALPQMPTSSSSRVVRTTSLVRSRRIPGPNMDGTTDDEEASPSVRPVSRAMTEVNSYRQAARNRAAYSREYTAQHPMPQHPVPSVPDTTNTTRSQLPAHISTHLVPRRKYATPPSAVSNAGAQEYTPVTPREPWGRITIVPAVSSSPIEATPESQVVVRPPPPPRRSLGFTSRISSVGSRLRAAKGERNISMRDTPELRTPREPGTSGPVLDSPLPLERHQTSES